MYYRVNGPQIEVLRILHHAREVGHAFDLM
ncbi:MAG: hypothetical protein LBK95_00325 [Bifidobacteriaceae bacterium]|nr:hypothetical protein [Bifidobacteriaceae bacterium]